MLAIEQAWAAIQQASTAPAILAAADLGAGSAQVLAIAAGKLTDLGQPEAARTLLERGISLQAPPAPIQLGLARNLHAAGDLDGSRRWLMGTMLRARADAALGYELAAVEAERGELEAASAVADAAGRLDLNDRTGAIAAARRLRTAGAVKPAYRAFHHAFERGARDWEFLVDFQQLIADNPDLPVPDVDPPLLLQAAHARLALGLDMAVLLARPQRREASDRWLDRGDLGDFLAERIAARQPFSWIRVGDGLARFLAYAEPTLRGGLTADEAEALGRWLWSSWFGSDITAIERADLVALRRRVEQAIGNADLLGVPSSARLANDRHQAGFCALLEQHLATIAPDGGRYFTDSLFNYTLNEIDPFYQRLLGNLDFLGLVGPHRELGPQLSARFGIRDVRSWIIPGEGRLQEMRSGPGFGSHFPDAYERTLAELAVPRRGALFLVAGGLLGKVYCDRIRELGGIALDVGAVVDAWMGLNTRGVVLDASMRHRLVP